MEHERSRTYARRNEEMLRGANAAIERDAEGDGEDRDRQHELLCECAEACGTTIRLTFAEWNAAHDRDNRFTVAADHEDPNVETVIARHDTFLVVEKQ